jgi:hypothetical protein
MELHLAGFDARENGIILASCNNTQEIYGIIMTVSNTTKENVISFLR